MECSLESRRHARVLSDLDLQHLAPQLCRETLGSLFLRSEDRSLMLLQATCVQSAWLNSLTGSSGVPTLYLNYAEYRSWDLRTLLPVIR